MPVDYYCHYFNYLQFCPLIWKRLSVQPFMNATFTAFNADIQTDTLSSNYELCSGVSVAVGRELVHWKRRNNLFCSYSPWCMYLALLLFSFPPFFCAIVHLPPNQRCLLKTDGAPKKRCRVIDTCRNWVTFGPVSICKFHCQWFIENL